MNVADYREAIIGSHYSPNQFDRGIAMIERVIAKGLGKRIKDGKLHLAIVYHLAGRKADALKTFACN